MDEVDARGRAIEQSLGTNLPSNSAALTSRLNGYVDSAANFNGANWANVNIDASQITARQLQLAVPQGSASAAQQAAINAAAARAQSMGVNFIVTPIP